MFIYIGFILAKLINLIIGAIGSSEFMHGIATCVLARAANQPAASCSSRERRRRPRAPPIPARRRRKFGQRVRRSRPTPTALWPQPTGSHTGEPSRVRWYRRANGHNLDFCLGRPAGGSTKLVGVAAHTAPALTSTTMRNEVANFQTHSLARHGLEHAHRPPTRQQICRYTSFKWSGAFITSG